MESKEHSGRFNRYVRYKSGTNEVVVWLNETYQTNFRAERARNESTWVPSVSELVSMAQKINDAEITVPYRIVNLLSEVIQLREDAREWYAHLQTANTRLRTAHTRLINEQHSHFITVLKDIRSYLAPYTQPRPKNIETEDQNTDLGSFSNAFDSLRVEDPVETALGSAPASKLHNRKIPHSDISEHHHGGKSFFIWCLLQDIFDIREHVRGIWQRYYSGDISFAVSTMLTDTASGMIMDLVSKCDAFPEVYHFDGIGNFFDLKIEQGSHQVLKFTSGADAWASGLQAASLFSVTGFCMLQDFIRLSFHVRRGSVAALPGLFRNEDAFAVVLKHIEADLRLLASQYNDSGLLNGFKLDWFTRALLDTIRTRRVSTWSAALCEMYVDFVYPAMGMKPDLGLAMLRNVAYETSKAIQDYLTAFEDAPETRTMFEDCLQPLLTDTNDVLNDTVSSWTGKLKQCKPSILFSNLPLLAGHTLNALKTARHLWSVQLANRTLGVLGAGHLYAAAPKQIHWTDMDFVFQRNENYVLQASDVAGFARHFDLALEVPASAFGRSNERRPHLPAEIKNVRHPIEYCALVKAMHGFRHIGKANAEDAREYHEVMHRTLNAAGKRNREGQRIDRSLVQLLSAFEKTLVTDEEYLNFDMLTFAARCTELINMVYSNCNGRLHELLGRLTIAQHEIVDAILWEAADAEHRVGLKPMFDTLLVLIPEYFEQIQALDPVSLTNKAQRVSSGHIPEAHKPCNRWKWESPGYINGKRVFGPETPWDCKGRELEEAIAEITASAHDEWDRWKEEKKVASAAERVRRIESWLNTKLRTAGIDKLVRRVHYDRFEDTVSFEL